MERGVWGVGVKDDSGTAKRGGVGSGGEIASKTLPGGPGKGGGGKKKEGQYGGRGRKTVRVLLLTRQSGVARSGEYLWAVECRKYESRQGCSLPKGCGRSMRTCPGGPGDVGVGVPDAVSRPRRLERTAICRGQAPLGGDTRRARLRYVGTERELRVRACPVVVGGGEDPRFSRSEHSPRRRARG